MRLHYPRQAGRELGGGCLFSPCQFAGYLSMLRLVGTDQSAGVFWEISRGLNKGGWRVKTLCQCGDMGCDC